MKAKAKHDVKALMEDNRFSNFKEGNEYRCMMHGEIMIKSGLSYDIKSVKTTSNLSDMADTDFVA